MATTFTNQAALAFNGARVLSNVAVGRLENILTVTKTAVEQEYSAGSTVTYVVSIVNSSASPLTGLTLTDDLGAYPFGTGTVQPLTYVDGSVVYLVNGAVQPDPTVATTDGLIISGITVEAGGNTTVIYSAQVNSYAPLETGSTVDNTVAISGAGIGDDTQASESIAVADGADLSVIKSVSPIPVVENGTITYTIQIVNTGNSAVLSTDNAVITDTFDPILYNVTATLDGVALTPTEFSYSETTGEFSTANGVIAVPAASYAQDPATGEWVTTPASVTIAITGSLNNT